MVEERKPRAALTTSCYWGVRKNLPVGSLKEVAQLFKIDPKTVSTFWKSTLKQVPGYQPGAPLQAKDIALNVPGSAFDTKFQNAGWPHNISPELPSSIQPPVLVLHLARSTIILILGPLTRYFLPKVKTTFPLPLLLIPVNPL